MDKSSDDTKSTKEKEKTNETHTHTECETQPEDKLFACNICFENATNPVLSICGHLFDWPCIYRWLSMHPNGALCPVCKAGISKDKLIPIYGRGGNRDPREDIPDRPRAQRPPPPSQHHFAGGPHVQIMGPHFHHEFFGPSIFSTMTGLQFQHSFNYPNDIYDEGRNQELAPGDYERRNFAQMLLALGMILLLSVIFL